MMKPFIVSELESHLITAHGVSPELISRMHQDGVTAAARRKLQETSHKYMHVAMTGIPGQTPHTHEDEDDEETDETS